MARVTEPLSAVRRALPRARRRPPAARRDRRAPTRSRSPTACRCRRRRSNRRCCWPGSTRRARPRVIEPQPTRDHTERMLRHFGATVAVEPAAGGGRRDHGRGPARARRGADRGAGRSVLGGLPAGRGADRAGLGGDDRAASGINPLRTGLLECLREMGADIALVNERDEGGEPVADLRRPRRRAEGRRRSGRARAADDRRIPDPGRRRRLRARAAR